MMFAEFCKNSKPVLSDLSVIKNVVAPLFCPSSFPNKLICCFKSGSSNSIYWLKSIAISL